MSGHARMESHVNPLAMLTSIGAEVANATFLRPPARASVCEAAIELGCAARPSSPSPAQDFLAASNNTFFGLTESAFIEAAVDAIIPNDANGPGARELGVSVYIDRWMARHLGQPSQDVRLRHNSPRAVPAVLIRTGIAEINAHVQTKYNKPFDALSVAERVAILANLGNENIELPTVALAEFLNLLLRLTVEGYLSDSIAPENGELRAWTLMGFPGVETIRASDPKD